MRVELEEKRRRKERHEMAREVQLNLPPEQNHTKDSLDVAIEYKRF